SLAKPFCIQAVTTAPLFLSLSLSLSLQSPPIPEPKSLILSPSPPFVKIMLLCSTSSCTTTPFFFLFFFFHLHLVLTTSAPCPGNGSNATTIYEALKEHELPMGLFPKGVTDFELGTDGRFWVHLEQACNAKFESELHYDSNVSGSLSCGKIDSLTGMEAQDLFLWFPVVSIRVDLPSSGIIYFDVGAASKKFKLSLFETPPDCVAVKPDNGLSASSLPRGESGRPWNLLDQEPSGTDVL
ncbi:hypothetical protein S83_004105, partial [Arachis hypogaea]